jgi:hypothetical protein
MIFSGEAVGSVVPLIRTSKVAASTPPLTRAERRAA